MTSCLVQTCVLIAIINNSVIPEANGALIEPSTRAYCSMILKAAKVDFWLVERPLGRSFSAISSAHLSESTPHTESYILEKRLGSGYNGTVYKVRSLSKNSIFPTVGKFGNLYMWSPRVSPEEPSLKREWEDSLLIEGYRMKSGEPLPVLPILDLLQTDHGIMLLKPLATGLFLSDIKKQYGARVHDLPSEMRSSIRRIFHFAQTLNQKVEVVRDGTGVGFKLDIKPENLVWITDPRILKVLGLLTPQFVLIEATHSKHPKWVYAEQNMSEQEYLDVFQTYLENQ
ncbi:MAG: serine/threonine-protein kinase [Bdellovibrionales bacterium]|nr:serine/threonine-protein kinase [Bdellovibrionales bacterium]